MASNNNPPVQLHPDLDQSTMVSYINENFRKQADAFNPFRISEGSQDRIIIGRYEQSRYGLIGLDEDGTRRILLGSAPDDGRIGFWISKEGQDVIELLGG